MSYNFEIDDAQLAKLYTWKAGKPIPKDALQMGYTYSFTPHRKASGGLGTVLVVKCNTDGTEINLTDFEDW